MSPIKTPTFKIIVRTVYATTLVLLVLIFWTIAALCIYGDIAYDDQGEIGDYGYLDNVACNVSDIKLQGNIATYTLESDEDMVSSEALVAAIREADEDDGIKAILLEIDSTGGSPVASEEIADALKRARKPTVAVIREYGDSGAYWVATGADRIFASASSELGSIGVTMSYLDNSQQNTNDGLVYNQISAGKFKDTGSPDKTLTEEERQLLQRDIDILHENFIDAVATNRNLDADKVRALADGSTMLGDAALANGLIDRIGGISEAEEYLAEVIGEEARICQK